MPTLPIDPAAPPLKGVPPPQQFQGRASRGSTHTHLQVTIIAQTPQWSRAGPLVSMLRQLNKKTLVDRGGGEFPSLRLHRARKSGALRPSAPPRAAAPHRIRASEHHTWQPTGRTAAEQGVEHG